MSPRLYTIPLILAMVAQLALASASRAQGAAAVVVSDNVADKASASLLSAVIERFYFDVDVITTEWGEISSDTLALLASYSLVYVVGGPLAVPPKVELTLGNESVIRLYGEDRVETSLAVLREVLAITPLPISSVVIADGYSTQSVEAGESLAEATLLPLVLVSTPKLHEVADELRKMNIKEAIIADSRLAESLSSSQLKLLEPSVLEDVIRGRIASLKSTTPANQSLLEEQLRKCYILRGEAYLKAGMLDEAIISMLAAELCSPALPVVDSCQFAPIRWRLLCKENLLAQVIAIKSNLYLATTLSKYASISVSEATGLASSLLSTALEFLSSGRRSEAIHLLSSSRELSEYILEEAIEEVEKNTSITDALRVKLAYMKAQALIAGGEEAPLALPAIIIEKAEAAFLNGDIIASMLLAEEAERPLKSQLQAPRG